MLIIYRVVVRRGRDDVTTGIPKHCDTTKPKLNLQTSTTTPFSGMGYEFSPSPTMSIRGFDGPFPPPYATDPFCDFPIPQTPSANPAYVSWVEKLGIKQTV